MRTRIAYEDVMEVSAPPETVFPLLCPVREYDWIPDWRCEVIHSRSGVAEDGCVFQTDFHGEGKMTWVVVAYDPPRRIEFSCVVPDCLVMRLKIRLEGAQAGTRLHWTREFLSLSDGGDERLNAPAHAGGHRATMDKLERLLKDHLECSASAR